MTRRLRYALALLAVACVLFAQRAAAQGGAVLLVASPGFRDLEYRQTVVMAAPVPSGGYVGVIINRPTRRSLGSLFPEHEPSKKVVEPVYYGGPFSRGALVALVRSDVAPGSGTVPFTKSLYLAFRATTIDHVIETTPNQARYYVGYVGWRPGELKREIDAGLWAVLDPDPELVFRKDTDGLWEELLRQTRRLKASSPAGDAPGGAVRLARRSVELPGAAPILQAWIPNRAAAPSTRSATWSSSCASRRAQPTGSSAKYTAPPTRRPTSSRASCIGCAGWPSA